MCLASPLEMRDDNISRSGQSQEPKTLVDAHAILPYRAHRFVCSKLGLFVKGSAPHMSCMQEAKSHEPRAAAIANSSCADETGIKM